MPSNYERLRIATRAARVQSPGQVRDLRERLAGHTVEIVARVAGVMTNRRGQIVMLQCTASDGRKQLFSLDITPTLAGDEASMAALKADSTATVRILALVKPGLAEPMLLPLCATTEAEVAPLFREQGDDGVLIMSPVNGALPLPPRSPANAASLAQVPAAISALPRARVPQSRRAPAASSWPAPRARLAPRASGTPAGAARVPSLSPLSPSVIASAQRAPRVQARPSEPAMFADDERIDDQMPAYEDLVRRFNKKLGPAQVEEIAHGLLAAAYSQNMDPRFLAAIVAVESDFDPRCLSSSGAMGLGQVMPFNFPEVGMDKADGWDPTKNLLATAMLLRGHLNDYKSRPNGTLLAVAAYNAGPGAVKRAGYKVPRGAQVQRYVWKVYYRYKEFAPELFR